MAVRGEQRLTLTTMATHTNHIFQLYVAIIHTLALQAMQKLPHTGRNFW